MSNSTSDSNSSNLIQSIDSKTNDKYKLKCTSIRKLIKEMIFYNGCLDMRLKENAKEITKLKLQREYLISKLIVYERLDVNAIDKFDEEIKLTASIKKSATKKRVKSSDGEKKRSKPTTTKLTKNRLDKKIDLNELNDENLKNGLINNETNDLTKEYSNQTMDINYSAIEQKTANGLSNKFETIPISRIDQQSNLITNLSRSTDLKTNLQINPSTNLHLTVQPNQHFQMQPQTNDLQLDQMNSINNNKIIESFSSEIDNSSLSSSLSTSNGLLSNHLITNVLPTNKSINGIITTTSNGSNSHSLNNSSVNLLSNLSTPNSLLISNNLSTSNQQINQQINLSNSSSSSNSLSNFILNHNKNDTRILINNHQSFANKQFIIKKPFTLNENDLKHIKNLTSVTNVTNLTTSINGSIDENTIANYVNSDLDKTNGKNKTINFGLIV